MDGTTTVISSTNLEVSDKNIVINNGGNDATSEGAGVTVERTATDGSIVYEDALTSKFKCGAVGSEVEIVTKSAAQVITNKDHDGGTASNTSRLTIPKNTKTNLDGLARKQGTIVYASDEDKIYSHRIDNNCNDARGGAGVCKSCCKLDI